MSFEVRGLNALTKKKNELKARVLKTGNRSYGNTTVSEKATEFQQYASNANFTVNLLHSLSGIDYYNSLDSPSNGFELLHFFEDAVEIQCPDGSILLKRSDCVMMDICSFHHGLFVESVQREQNF